MQIEDARRLIASYLTGRPVSGEALAAACEMAKTDAEYIQYLKEELGLRSDWVSECDVFLSNLAEFGEMSSEERDTEMPGLMSHLAHCQSCRRAYWEVVPLWKPATAPGGGGPSVKRLAEGLVVVADTFGRVRQSGWGPSPEEVVVAAAAAGGEPAAAGLGGPQVGPHGMGPRRWVFRDEEGGCTIHLEVCGRESGGMAIGCRLEAAEASPATSARLRLEVRQVDNNVLFVAGPLANFLAAPLFLPWGEWLIRLLAAGAADTHVWEIPLSLEQENAHDDSHE